MTYDTGAKTLTYEDFNVFINFGKIYLGEKKLKDLYDKAETKFSDPILFSAITITDKKSIPSGTTPFDWNCDGIRDTLYEMCFVTGYID